MVSIMVTKKVTAVSLNLFKIKQYFDKRYIFYGESYVLMN